MKKLNLNESFISRIWEENSFYSDLKTTSGLDVEVLDYGRKNLDAGADYKDTRIKIGGSIYCGDIEIHKTLKDWYRHRHKRDDKYNKVILHVVFWEPEENEMPVRKKSREIHTVVLSRFLTKSIHSIWKDIINTPSEEFKLPCFTQQNEIDPYYKKDWIKALSFKRLKHRTGRLFQRLSEYENRKNISFWEQVLFEYTLEALGFSKNKEQFLKLAGIIDLDIIKKNNLSLLETDALLFGVAGFLDDIRTKDDYTESLKRKWEILHNKLHIETMFKSEWNFFKLRPRNFPTLRISYASAFAFGLIYNDIFNNIIRLFVSGKDVYKSLLSIFWDISVSTYWMSHYNFGRERKYSSKIIGRDRINDIITNTLLPLMYLYSEEFYNENIRNLITKLYEEIKIRSENSIVKAMEKQLHFKARTISEEQGLIQLHNFYCIKGKCDSCNFGRQFFRESSLNYLNIILY